MTEAPLERPFWDQDRQSAYLAQARARQAAIQARREGAELARNLDAIWASLPAADRAILRNCLIRGSDEVIADQDAVSLRGLLSCGLLHAPRGCGSSWMWRLRTVYRIAPAPWRALLVNRDRYLAEA